MSINSASVTMAAIDRFIDVRNSQRPTVGVFYSTTRRVFIASGIICFIGVLFSSPNAYFQTIEWSQFNFTIHGNGSITDDYITFEHCVQRWPSNELKMYSIAHYLVQVIAPTLTLVFTSKYIRRRAEEGNEAQVSRKHGIRDDSIQLTLFLMSLSFAVFWIPYHTFNLVLDLEIVSFGHDFQSLYLYLSIVHSLAMISVPTSAIVYGWFTPSIRRELICLCKDSRANNINVPDENVIALESVR